MNTPAPIVNLLWNHNVPSEAMQQYDLQLMTICGVSVLGRWCGQFGEYYVGWAPLLGATPAQLQGYIDTTPDYDLEYCPAPEPSAPAYN